METADQLKARAAATYNAASDHYEEEAVSFWGRFGARTIERLGLGDGSSVLDVCCGSGGSALPAAQRVGPTGHVLAVDLADRLLALGRAKAAESGLDNVEFRQGDMGRLGLTDGHFDAVVCVFGIFLASDMPRQVSELWRMVRPGGTLAVTTWGPDAFEPFSTVLWSAVREERPDLYRAFNPWDRIVHPDAVRHLLVDGGARNVEVEALEGEHPLASAEDAWTIALGSGLRGTIDQLGRDARDRVRRSVVDWLRRHDIRAVTANVIFATATKPSGP